MLNLGGEFIEFSHNFKFLGSRIQETLKILII